MSNIIAPAKWEELTLSNSSISSNKWHFSENDKTGLAKTIEGLGFVAVMFGFLFLFGAKGPVPELMANGVIFLISFLATLAVAAFFLLPNVSKRVIAGREKKRNEYRAQHASTIIDALGEHGWTVLGENAVETIVKDNNPYMLNENGIRYYARQLYIGRENIDVVFTLSDPKAEKAMKEAEKQERIAFEIDVHERKNGGPMTPEEKAAFVAALTIVL